MQVKQEERVKTVIISPHSATDVEILKEFRLKGRLPLWRYLIRALLFTFFSWSIGHQAVYMTAESLLKGNMSDVPLTVVSIDIDTGGASPTKDAQNAIPARSEKGHITRENIVSDHWQAFIIPLVVSSIFFSMVSFFAAQFWWKFFIACRLFLKMRGKNCSIRLED